MGEGREGERHGVTDSRIRILLRAMRYSIAHTVLLGAAHLHVRIGTYSLLGAGSTLVPATHCQSSSAIFDPTEWKKAII